MKERFKILVQLSVTNIGMFHPFGIKLKRTQVKEIEQVQINTARCVMNQPYSPHNPSSVAEMLNKLKWPSLEQRRVQTDVTLMYKVVNCFNYCASELPSCHCHFTFYKKEPQHEIHSNSNPDKSLSELIFSTDCHNLEHDTEILYYLCESGRL